MPHPRLLSLIVSCIVYKDIDRSVPQLDLANRVLQGGDICYVAGDKMRTRAVSCFYAIAKGRGIRSLNKRNFSPLFDEAFGDSGAYSRSAASDENRFACEV